MDKINIVAITADSFNEVISYLHEKPFREVGNLVPKLLKESEEITKQLDNVLNPKPVETEPTFQVIEPEVEE